MLAFLRAEIDSPRFANGYLQQLAWGGVSRTELIDLADLENEADNALRRDLLARFRGFGANMYLFAGFPDDVQWQWVRISQADQSILKYANCQPWIGYSGGTRFVTGGADNLAAMDAQTKSIIESIAEGVLHGKTFPPVITVKSLDGFLILVEGHCRATAYVAVGFSGNVDLFVGSSPGISKWAFY